MSESILEKLQIDNSGDGGSLTNTYQSDILTEADAPEDAETVDVVEGFSVRRGYRKSPTVRILDPDAFSPLVSAMEGRYDTKFTYTWKDGNTSVLSGLKIRALPLMGVVPDNVTVWYDTDTSATDNPGNESDTGNSQDGSWTKLTEVLGETSADTEVITRPNGRGLPYYVAGRFVHDIPLFYGSTAYNNIKTEEDNRNEVRIAIENQAGNYRVYGAGGGSGVHVEIHENIAPQFDEVPHMILRCYQTGSFDDIITYPSGADDYFYGVEVMGEAFGHDEGDILTENRT